MRLSWNEIRARAAKFSEDWSDACYEKGETQSFYNDFFEVFGIKRRSVAVYERHVVNKLNHKQGFIDLFWPSVLLVEHKSAGKNLDSARKQAEEYCAGLKKSEFPRYILVSDFQNFELYDLDERIETKFRLPNLDSNVEKLAFITGVQQRSFKDQDPVNIKASELMGRVHDELEESGYTGHNLEQFLVRLLFCLFADNTGIFERDIFLKLIEDRTAEDGSDLGQLIAQLFQVLNTPEDKRSSKLDEDLAAFPYINGDLFEEALTIPSFDRKMRAILIEACKFSWDAISPAIFGSLFQSVMNKEQRRKKGAHYTTEKNIMKVIGPLFLDDLRAEFKRIKVRKTHRQELLEEFQSKLASLKFFDPACGCGNFLIIAYRELRQLELEVIIAMRTAGYVDSTDLDAENLSKVDVDQFYGIELDEFPVRIAEAAMWMMDHIMNNRLSLKFGEIYVRIPLKKSPSIRHADALETDWASVLKPDECNYVFGNPPFLGSKIQSDKQREQVRRIAVLGKSGGTLDYVTAWFLKAGEYAQQGSSKIGFVATNSITQGEQVAQLWDLLFDRYQLEITFAHQTFGWGSDAKGKAHVHVVIIGLGKSSDAPTDRRLFSYESINGEPHESQHKAITPYLFDASGLKNRHLVVTEVSRPLNGLPKLIIGSKPIDGGHFILSPEEKLDIEAKWPQVSKYIHPYIGAKEFLQGHKRYILYLAEAVPEDIRDILPLKEAIANVRDYRLGKIPAKGKASATIKKPGISSLQLAETPKKFHVTVVPKSPFLVIPRVSSESRQYIPIGYMEPPVIASDAVLILMSSTKFIFGLLSSSMHMSWMRYFAGRLKSDYRYSIGVVYNTFPLPPKLPDEAKIEPLVDAVLDARAAHPDTTLADLYDRDQMPLALKKAHTALDKAVDNLYRHTPFPSESARVEHLVDLYETMISSPIERAAKKKPPKK